MYILGGRERLMAPNFKSQIVMRISFDGGVNWHERTRVEVVTDGEDWEIAHYVAATLPAVTRSATAGVIPI